MKKRILSILLVAVMLMSVVPLSASAASGNGWTLENGVLTVSKDPSTISGEYLPYASEVREVVIKASAGSPYDGSFGAGGEFYEMENLKKITVEQGISSIGMYAFGSCPSVTEIILPEGLQSLGTSAFYGFSSLTSIDIPASVNEMEGCHYLFGQCYNLKAINVAAGNQKYASIDGVVYDKEVKTLLYSPLAKEEVTVPDTVTSINPYAFQIREGNSITTTTVNLSQSLYDTAAEEWKAYEVFIEGLPGVKFVISDGMTDDPTDDPIDDPVDEPDTPVTPTQFKDVPTDAYYADAVAWAVENNITQGTSEDSFSPNSSCTRAQAVTFLWRAAGSPKVSGSTGFSDVTADAYYADAVKWAVANEITQGTGDGKFSPNETCDRRQIVTFMWRAAGFPDYGLGTDFTDVPDEAYYSGAVKWAVLNGITEGTGNGKFSPDSNCVRAQIVTFLYRAYA